MKLRTRTRIRWVWAAWGFGFAAWNAAVLIWGDRDWWWLNALSAAICLTCGLLSVFELKPTRKAAEPVANTPNPNYSAGGYLTSDALQKALTGQFTLHTSSFSALSAPTPSAPTEPEPFHGLPFELAVGEVYGLRMWHMDKYGRLRARNWEGAPPWRPGVNEARCVKRHLRELTISGFFSSPSDYTWTVEEDPGHEVPSEACSCGFYAYTDTLHAEVKAHVRDGAEPVLGVIKGTGRTLIGTQGFRCEKAEIVALRDPTRGGTETDRWQKRQLALLRRVYPDIPILDNRAALLEFAPLTDTVPSPDSDEFWSLP